ncbi:methyl-accepting chemotaxis protein [Amphibacillus cookii]|uniref:methyl-accepting chemotaxis protein n=1 Tax=Amphibacillus cookii TaxID=767787 RepID=UPI00195E55A9|nr:methyl-accepting chemotaxis protein [Amphibacillus cookii]MBM7542298.1 methyl-accepting chemotaxis protein [Amphibacillus cookii]
MKRIKTLKVKMILLFTLLVVGVALSLSVLSMWGSRTAIRELAEESLYNLADEAAKHISATRNKELIYMETLARADILDADNRSELVSFFSNEQDATGYMGFGYADMDGVGHLFNQQETEQDFSGEDFLTTVLNGESTISDVIVGDNFEQPYIVIAVPVFDGNAQTGFLYGLINALSFSETVNEITYGESGRSAIIDSEGNFQAHSEAMLIEMQMNIFSIDEESEGTELEDSREDEDTSLDELLALFETEMVNREVGVGEHTFAGDAIYVGYAPIAASDWIFMIEVDQDEIFAGLNQLNRFIILGSVLFTALAVVVTYLISRSITNPIQTVTHSLNRIANYDLRKDESDKRFAKVLNRNDELGDIGRSNEAMRQNLTDLIATNARLAEQVSASSEELMATSEQAASAAVEVSKVIEEISSGATEQAKDTENGVEYMQDLQAKMKDDHLLIEKMNQSNKAVAERKDQGLVKMQELSEKSQQSVTSAKEVKDIIHLTNESVEKISQSSEKIRDIAEQTNLLALNAAIEAARAGEAGQGFAVVADEVRKLAEQSNQFTGEIVSVIQELAAKSAQAVDAIEQVDTNMNDQVAIVRATNDQFDGIAAKLEDMNVAVEDLTESGKLMQSTSGNIFEVLHSLSAVSEQNAASTQEASASVTEQTNSMNEIAESSESLAELAQDLQESVIKFKHD